jgi:hypothetical protein
VKAARRGRFGGTVCVELVKDPVFPLAAARSLVT